MLTNAKILSGYTVHGSDGDIGTVKQLFFDDHFWVIRYLVVETGSWLNSRRVLVSPYAVVLVDNTNKLISVGLTQKQIEKSPTVNTDMPVSRQFEESYHGYYGWPPYWVGSYTWGNSPMIVRDPGQRQATNVGGKPWDLHLRSTTAVHGYHIQASDGAIGHLKDYIIDDVTWEILYLVVDTKNWLPGKTVLVSPRWISKVSWVESKVFVNLSRAAIKASPEYSEDGLLTREYETVLHHHYGASGYWVADPPETVPHKA